MFDSRFAPVFMLLVAMTCIQSGASLAKQLFPAVGAEGAAALRLVFAALILCMVWRPWRTKLTRREALFIMLYGLSIGGMNLLIYLSLERIPLGIAVALEFTGPLAVALLTSRRLLDFLWVVFAALGIILFLPVSGFTEALDPVGVGYALAAGLCWALYILFGQKAGMSLHSGTATALGMTVAMLFVFPFGVAQAGEALFNGALVPLAVSVAVLTSALPYTLEMAALKRLPRKTFGILMSLEPAIGALSGLVFLSEQLSPLHYLAIGCIIGASIGSTVSIRRATITPEMTA